MIENSLALVKFEKHFNLLKSLTRRIAALGVYGLQGECVWEGALAQDDAMEQVRSFVRENSLKWRHSLDEVESHQVKAGRSVQLTSLRDGGNEPVAILVALSVDEEGEDHQQVCSIDQALQALADCIHTEIGFNQALHDKDNELAEMADELVERYEELNLVYDADDQFQNTHQGQESLRHLVHSCTSFLDVGMTALLLPGKRVAIYDFNPSAKKNASSKMISAIRTDLYRWIETNNQAVVINSMTDTVRYQLFFDTPCKLLACPVHSGEMGTIGMLVIINRNDKQDFTNSDRNLLDVMSKKVTKIIQENFDALTGLENIHSFEWNVQEALTQARERGRKHALLNIDLDRFSVINDISGRDAGDQLIRIVGRMIQKIVRSRDVVGRLSGDTFGVLLESCPLETAVILAKNIRREIAAIRFEWQGQTHEVSASIGIAPITAESDSVASIFSTVEVALNAAKERGDNRLQVFEVEDVDLVRRKDEMHWVSRIQTALRENCFELYAQLIQPLQSGKGSSHYEILLRMIGEDGKLIPPGAFLPAAEHYHLMPGIDRWVIKRAFTQLSESARTITGFPCRIAINLSGQSLSDEAFQQFVCEQLHILGQHRRSVCFEVTESAAIANLQEARGFISAVKEMGCEFSLDDFGTGLSSFAYLQNLEVDYLKIDGSFVREIETNEVSRTMVSAINQVGHAMGLRTIAEFVENDAIAHYLRQIGVDYGQGYGLGKPQPLRSCLHDLVSAQKVAS